MSESDTAYLAQLKELERLRLDVLDEYELFNEEQLTFQPEPGHWNLLQVLDHLVTTEKMSAIYIKRQLTAKKYPPAPGFKSKMRYLLLKTALHLPFRYKAPAVVDSTGRTPQYFDLKENWEIIRREIETIVETTDADLLELGVFSHPRAGLLNMEQALDFLARHLRHHKKQVERIKTHEKFPVLNSNKSYA